MTRTSFLPFVCAAALLAPPAWAQGASTPDDETLHGPAPPHPQQQPSAPRAPEPAAPPFGARGEFVTTGASVVGLSWTWWDASQAWAYSATFSPGVDLFVAHNISVGVTVHLGYADNYGYGADGSLVETESSTLRWGVRGGVNLPLGSNVSWYPRLTIGFESVHSEERLVPDRSPSTAGSALGYPSTTQWGPWVELFAPVLFHPKSHLFVGVGPDVFLGFGHAQGGPDAGGQRTSVGAGVVVGGWWGGAAPSDVASTPAAPIPHRFGQAHQIVISGETAVSANFTYAGVASSSTTITVAPAIDYFVTDRVSVGVAFSLRSSDVTRIDPLTGLSVITDATGGGGALRLGVDLPIAGGLSFYPRGGLFVGVAGYDEKSGGHENKYSENIVSVVLYAPLLLHVAPHAFVGFGPSVSRDLDRSVQNASSENRSTGAGAGLLVGGWID